MGKLLSFPGREALAVQGITVPLQQPAQTAAPSPDPAAGRLYSPIRRQKLQEAPRGARREPRARARRGGRAARPERRRQDHLLLHDHGPDPPDDGQHHARRPRRHRAADVPARAPRHRLSAAGGLDLPRPDRRGEHPRRARGWSSPTARARRSSSMPARRVRASRHLRTSAGDARFRAASGGACEIARALATQSLLSSCSTSRLPASTRSPSTTSATWCAHLKDRGIGVLITDHNVRETLDIVDRAYIIHDGRC